MKKRSFLKHGFGRTKKMPPVHTHIRKSPRPAGSSPDEKKKDTHSGTETLRNDSDKILKPDAADRRIVIDFLDLLTKNIASEPPRTEKTNGKTTESRDEEENDSGENSEATTDVSESLLKTLAGLNEFAIVLVLMLRENISEKFKNYLEKIPITAVAGLVGKLFLERIFSSLRESMLHSGEPYIMNRLVEIWKERRVSRTRLEAGLLKLPEGLFNAERKKEFLDLLYKYYPESVDTNGTGFTTCTSCGAPIPRSSHFCTECGTKAPTELVCPGCGRHVDRRARFCPDCGAALG